MIISRPKSSALFALTVFIIIALSIAYAGVQNVILSGEWKWYNYLAVCFFGPMAFVLSVRMLINFKVIKIGKDKIELWYPFRLLRKNYTVKDVSLWKENTVKTGKSKFRELEIRLGKRKVKLSNQENTLYDQIVNYLQKKAKNKKG